MKKEMVGGLSIVFYRYHEVGKTKIIDYIYCELASCDRLNQVVDTDSLNLHCSGHKTLD